MQDNLLLERIYKALETGEEFEDKLYHSDVHYVRAALRDAGFEVSLEETWQAMYDEGMLPAEEYGIPKWFRRKYKMR